MLETAVFSVKYSGYPEGYVSVVVNENGRKEALYGKAEMYKNR